MYPLVPQLNIFSQTPRLTYLGLVCALTQIFIRNDIQNLMNGAYNHDIPELALNQNGGLDGKPIGIRTRYYRPPRQEKRRRNRLLQFDPHTIRCRGQNEGSRPAK